MEKHSTSVVRLRAGKFKRTQDRDLVEYSRLQVGLYVAVLVAVVTVFGFIQGAVL